MSKTSSPVKYRQRAKLTIKPEVPDGVYSFHKFSEEFKDYNLSKHFRPTQKQLDFVEHYLKTGDPEEAYVKAGYWDLKKVWPRHRRLVWWRVLHSKNVQVLLRLAMYQWAHSHQINPASVADRLLKIADTTDDLSVAVSAIRELNCMLGYHRNSGQKMAGERTPRKKKVAKNPVTES